MLLLMSSNNETLSQKNNDDEYVEDLHSKTSLDNDLIKDSKEDKHISLLAKDSEWADLTFHNLNYHTIIHESESEDEEEEIILVDPDDDKKLPIYTLFPSLSAKYPHSSSEAMTILSTSDLTKTLVGEEVNFDILKKSKRILPRQYELKAIPESASISSEDINSNNEASNVVSTKKDKTTSDMTLPNETNDK